MSLLHDGIDPLVVGYHGNWYPIVGFRRPIVHNEKAHVGLRRVRVPRDWNQSKTPSRMQRKLFPRNVTSLKVVYFKQLKGTKLVANVVRF